MLLLNSYLKLHLFKLNVFLLDDDFSWGMDLITLYILIFQHKHSYWNTFSVHLGCVIHNTAREINLLEIYFLLLFFFFYFYLLFTSVCCTIKNHRIIKFGWIFGDLVRFPSHWKANFKVRSGCLQLFALILSHISKILTLSSLFSLILCRHRTLYLLFVIFMIFLSTHLFELLISFWFVFKVFIPVLLITIDQSASIKFPVRSQCKSSFKLFLDTEREGSAWE